MSFEHGAKLLDKEVIETLRKRPNVSLTRNAQGALVQDEMGRLLISLREHSANCQRVTLLILDERAGHGIAQTVVRYATERGIAVSPEFVQFVFVSMRPGSPILGPFRRTPWPGGKPVAVARSTPAVNTTGVAAASTSVTASPGTKPASSPSAGDVPSLERPAQTARHQEFRLVRDKRFANGDREAVIQHLSTGITAQASTGGTMNPGYMEFALYDPDGEPLFLDVVVRDDNIDLTDPAEFNDLCAALRQIIPGADSDD